MGEVVRFPQPVPDVRGQGPEPLWRELVDVAEQAGVSTQYLSEVERGRKEPSSEMLQAITGALDLTVRQLAARVSRLSGPRCMAA